MITSEKTDIERIEEFLRANFRLDQRIDAIKNKKLYSLEIELTRRCNLECTYCYNSSSRNPALPDFDFNLLKRILREAFDYGIRSITYLGGEPTLHPEINEIIKFTKEIGMEEVVLYTNGTTMYEKLLDSINKYVDSVVFHMDTVNRDVFANLHNIEKESSFKYFETILNNLRLLNLSGYQSKKIRHCLTLLRPTYETLKNTLNWARKDMGMLTSIFIPVVQVGRGSLIAKENLLYPDEIKTSYEIRSVIESRPELLLLGPSEYCKQYQITTTYVTYDGFLLPYAGFSKNLICSINQGSLGRAITQNYNFLSFDHEEEFHENKKRDACKNSRFCFGTKTAYKFSDLNKECDPNCWL